MKSMTGTCKFCGQVAALSLPESYTEAMADDEATKKCKCEAAIAEAERQDIITAAEANIHSMTKDKEELIELRKQALGVIEPLSRWSIHKASYVFGNYTLTMKRKEKKIAISLKYTDEDKRE